MLKKEDVPNLAKKTIEEYILHGRMYEIDQEISEELNKEAGVFVTLKKNGDLRGCIGTIRPTQKNIAAEVQKNAISAAEHDPRFPAVSGDELNEIDYSVDIIGEMEKVDSKEELNPKKFGIMVKGGHQTGLLLPDLEGIDTIEKQINIARKKAGLSKDADIEIYRFEVKRYKE
ncbi:MAG TPA: AmmeMemoRadiSam system protein A [Halanaerobiales bacterium]|nr:AmmeMemoRadiSam system protein A [Halanaerobiales bacterium]